MELKAIYQPIEKELEKIEQVLGAVLKNSNNQSILSMNRFLLESPGKRIRPALLILSAKAACVSSKLEPACSPRCEAGRQGRAQSSREKTKAFQLPVSNSQLIKIASAIELIHMASLVHDDVIDNSLLRHHRPTVNHKWGDDVSIALGDYLYALAFELISTCGDMWGTLQCVSSATKIMCEGELLQVCERDNLSLLKERYIVIVKKKTAALFAASCQAGALVSAHPHQDLEKALKGYGLNFGIAFQIADDYLDLVGEQNRTGKTPGQDIKAGEVTLPILNLWELLSLKERKELKALLTSEKSREVLPGIKQRLFDTGAAAKTKEAAASFTNLAKEKINMLSHSPYKKSLLNLADFVIERGFDRELR